MSIQYVMPCKKTNVTRSVTKYLWWKKDLGNWSCTSLT